MSNFCKNCGTELKEGAKFCTNCGQGVEQQVAIREEVMSGNANGVSKRSIPLALILAFITCGIYGLYWECKMNDEVNELLHKKDATSGLLAVIYTMITCGIYGIYWLYKMGEDVEVLKGKTGANTGLLYLIMGIFGLGIIPFALIQDTINDKVDGLY